MPASLPPSRPDVRPRSALRADESGVSEIVGYILTFAILSTVLLIAMLTFGAANRQAEQRVLEVEAASVAHRVAAAVVEADLYLNAPDREPQELLLRLELPLGFGSDGYTVELCKAPAAGVPVGAGVCGHPTCESAGAPDADTVRVVTRGVDVRESILGSHASRSCVSGGLVALRLESPTPRPPGPSFFVHLVQA